MDVEKIIRDYLPEVVHMSLATVKNDKPWVCEVHFVYDDDLNLYFRSLTSRRHSQEIAENTNVAGNIIKQHHLGDAPLGVYFEGKAEQLTSADERKKALPFFEKRLKASDDILTEAEREDGHQFYKITVENWYVFGRFGEGGSQKYQLTWHGHRAK
jgi:uncharacterized protein YhbP (UPF0306 family)